MSTKADGKPWIVPPLLGDSLNVVELILRWKRHISTCGIEHELRTTSYYSRQKHKNLACLGLDIAFCSGRMLPHDNV